MSNDKWRRIRHHRWIPIISIIPLISIACEDPFAAQETRFYQAVATGGEHSCAVATDGAGYCWGKGSDGQLGTGSTANQSSPARVKGNFEFTSITAGLAHTCGMTTDGSVLCWGNGTAQPVSLATTTRFTSISAGSEHTCAIAADSLAYCWGDNTYGQLGDSTTTDSAQPRVVRGALKFVQLDAGRSHTCGVTASGDAYCWGRNEHGQLGDSSTVAFQSAPSPVQSDVPFTQIDAGGIHTCAVGVDTRLFCWGGNAFGELGVGAAAPLGVVWSRVPVTISPFFHNGASISAGEHFTCAMSLFGEAWCWGRGDYGQLGIGRNVTNFHPQPVGLHFRDGFAPSLPSTAGTTHACALAYQRVYCWGTGVEGQLGVANVTYSPLPQRVEN